MAESAAHKFGQVVGDLLEEVVEPILRRFCEARGYYLDKRGQRVGVRSGRKLTWVDKYSNMHDLDFVIEKDGEPAKLGRPVAFIETAWRRYTKHSRNKAQEIQGAVLPIAEQYSWDHPFLGAILAGVFTDGALEQMRSVGFEVLYFPYKTIVSAFANAGINLAFDESTPDDDFRACVQQIDQLSKEQSEAVKSSLIELNQNRIDAFFSALHKSLDRLIDCVIVIPLYGGENTFTTLRDAIQFITSFQESAAHNNDFRKFEVIVKFSNGDRVSAEFQEKERVLEFLKYVAG